MIGVKYEYCAQFKHILLANKIDKMDQTQDKQTYEVFSKAKKVNRHICVCQGKQFVPFSTFFLLDCGVVSTVCICCFSFHCFICCLCQFAVQWCPTFCPIYIFTFLVPSCGVRYNVRIIFGSQLRQLFVAWLMSYLCLLA